MNLDQYRELKQIESKEKEEGKTEETKVEEKIVEQPKVEEKKEENSKITIDGIGEVDIEELKKGYLRQNDYTKKTQELSNQKKELNDAVILHDFFKKNPEVAKLVAEKAPTLVTKVSQEGQKISELESKIELMKKENEIKELSKNKDFNLVDVENFKEEKGLKSLTDAYHLLKGESSKTESIDIDAITKKIREDIMKEIASKNVDTRTIIGSGADTETKVDVLELS